jgi:hypothetical protein
MYHGRRAVLIMTSSVRRKTTRDLLLLFGVVIALFAVYAAYNARVGMRLEPPATVTDMRSFLKVMPEPGRVYVHSIEDVECMIFEGPIPSSFLYTPSGPPAYVFDSSGKLVDWTTDRGDDPRFQATWLLSPRSRRELSDAEVQNLLDQHQDREKSNHGPE